MNRPFGYVQTSIGHKVIVALSGLLLAAFVVFHMLGNLQVFQGAAALNGYAAVLRDMPLLLWTARLGLLGLVGMHLVIGVRLAQRNRRARPEGYAARTYRRASFASRTMAASGMLLILFIIFHILHLTVGVVDHTFVEGVDGRGQRDVFGKVVHAFQNPLYVTIYLAAQAVLGLHLSHALSSSFQTLGLEHPLLDRLFRGTGPVVAGFVVVGNIVIILAIASGVVRA
ncbi:Succinate dehydrogenase/fumarate reductase, cytochrome b558 subunit [Nitrospira sp. KM1]|uniref:succinate dehydrogenase cytochrome b subunit n=1 Tax=Nitrospira sp. KM1 TaxID=1936990 RepID=UPI0013A729C4|nr:succinate dehydrogenase cytochrome b subunit [Nitrospira sp. KM1]BCA55169.1 Succinate dehydrogenase/fumarate reductase, cytochrome b558 subunit [Nitrospira sp. KM1]